MNYIKTTKSKLLSVILIGIIICVSCDKIPQSERSKIETTILLCDTPVFQPVNAFIQKHLLEDYTGHTCTNCPRAHKTVVELKAQMGDSLVVIAVHAGDNARPEGIFTADYRTEAGRQYAEEFMISSYPSGLINRAPANNRIVQDSKWKSTFNELVRKPASMGIQIMTEDNTENTCVFIKTSLLNDVTEKLRLCVLVTEDSIISPQKNGTKTDTFYVHNHVLRTSIAPVWGDVLDISANGESAIKGYSIDFKSTAWRKEHCHIVAFIYNENTKEILQVEELKLH